MKSEIPGPNLPQIWGGIECTINRVDDQYMDQLDIAGYYERGTDLQEIMGLGFKSIRYPVLWEKHQPEQGTGIDWNIADRDLGQMKENHVTPIIGLLHHGSGPRFTHLLDDNFPQLFAAYAARVASRFPWVEYYTPINEPLTTARFSGLYGLWYPHKTNDVSFVKMLLIELKASILAMKEIRKIQPAAKFLQTEDLGKTYSTPLLSYQASFENHRRWLSFDILFGRFTESHPLWNYFMRLGIDPKQLHFFIDNPCPPDIIGVNHYVTSERFLDEATDKYSVTTHGGNGIHRYADVEAVRVTLNEPSGLELLLKEIAGRYQTTLAITEVHMHCSREEQLRWLHGVLQTVIKLRDAGVDILAVTVWALLGSHGWSSLLTGGSSDYETGAFDCSAGKLRPTAIAKYISGVTKKPSQTMTMDLLRSPGWWDRPQRFFAGETDTARSTMDPRMKPLLIIGKNGTLGQAFARICTSRHIANILVGRKEVDICSSAEIEQIIKRYNPSCIINAAGYVKVDQAETSPDDCYRENTLGPQKLAILCEQYGIKLLSFSSDLVFDGESNEPYKESDKPKPLNVYGQSKVLAESFLSNVNPSSLIIRTSAFFGPWDSYNFIAQTLSAASRGEFVEASADIIVSPTYVPHLVSACLDLLIDDERGIWHLVNKGSCSWLEFAKMAAGYAGLDTSLILPGTIMKGGAERPRFSALSSEKYFSMPTLSAALEQYFTEIGVHPLKKAK